MILGHYSRQVVVGLICVTATAVASARDSSAVVRDRPKSVDPLQQLPANEITLPLKTGVDEVHVATDIDEQMAKFLQADDCASIVRAVPVRDYENTKPEVLALLAYCEPPGKDPEKMFTYAEQRQPDNDTIELLHARYRWRRQNPDAEPLFERIYSRTRDQRLKDLVGQYLVSVPVTKSRGANDLVFIMSGMMGGVQQANPRGVPLSDPSFGSDISTGGVAQVAMSVRKPFNQQSLGADYIVNDVTYWKTHDVDLLTQDADLPYEYRLSADASIGLRPYTSFYVLGGSRYYGLNGLGVTTTKSNAQLDQWLQLSVYQDQFYQNEVSNQGGTHLRLDWQSSLKNLPNFSPVVLMFIDYGRAGADSSGASYVPYSHTDWGGAVSVSKSLRHYSVGLTLRGIYRVDSDETRVVDAFGSTTTKIRHDLQIMIQPNLSVRIRQGIELFMYFESNSISSNLIRSDGLNRNISDNSMNALVRFSIGTL